MNRNIENEKVLLCKNFSQAATITVYISKCLIEKRSPAHLLRRLRDNITETPYVPIPKCE